MEEIGFLPKTQAPSLSELCGQADQALFSNIFHSHNHILHNLLPSLKMTGHHLRRPTWDRSQSTKDANNLIRKNFIYRLSNNNYFYFILKRSGIHL